MTRGILYIGHGTRRQDGIDDCRAFVCAVGEELRRRIGSGGVAADPAVAAFTAGATPISLSDVPTQLSFLELAEPDISTGMKALVDAGADEVTVVPLFLFAAGHIKSDIPQALALYRADRQLHLRQLAPFGNESAFVEAAIINVHALGPNAADAIVLVGRGNQDDDAQAAFESVTASMACAFANTVVAAGYLAGSGRAWTSVLDDLYAQGARTIILQPYLWFRGWLTEQLPIWVADWRARHPGAEVRIGTHLGQQAGMVRAVAGRIMSATYR